MPLINGNDTDETLAGSDGNDTVYGAGGNDMIESGLGDDLVYGEDGNDYVFDTRGNNTMYGGTGNDTLQAGSGSDYLDGGEGNDTLWANGNNDTLLGGTGTDFMAGGSGNDLFIMTAEAGAVDTLRSFGGVNGTDVIDMTSFTAIHSLSDLTIVQNGSNAEILLADGQKIVVESFLATDFTEAHFVFTPAPPPPPPELFGNGNEIVDFNFVAQGDYAPGTQTVDAMDGDDIVILSDANNWAYTAGAVFGGGNGHDTITGGAQNDVMADGNGNDVLTGSGGNDTFVFKLEASAQDLISDFTLGQDLIDLRDASFAAINYMSDLLITNVGDGAYVEVGNGHAIYLSGIDGTMLTANNFLGVAANPAPDPEPEPEPEPQPDLTIYGTAGNDNMKGTNADDVINGMEGHDQIKGGNGDDTLYGAAGNDKLYGSNGDDLLDGGDGNDHLEGGNGNDSLLGGGDKDSLYGANGDDSIDGGSGNDLLVGGNGNDTLMGGDGHDVLEGDKGNDEIDGGAGNDIILGGLGSNTLLGGAGRDTIHAGLKGDNLIVGGADKDILVAGFGKDTFLFESLDDSKAGARDTIIGLAGSDKIDLSGLGFTGIEKGDGDGSVLGWEKGSFGTVIISDADSDFTIEVVGRFSLSDGDFIF